MVMVAKDAVMVVKDIVIVVNDVVMIVMVVNDMSWLSRV